VRPLATVSAQALLEDQARGDERDHLEQNFRSLSMARMSI
jgi:hypothetical protein